MSLSFQTVVGAIKQHAKKALLGLAVLVVAGVGYVVASPAPSAQGALKGHTVQISRNGVIRVLFSQWMQHPSTERAFRISPALDGSFVWKGKELDFVPKTEFEKGKTYEVVVSTQAKSLFWKNLTEEYRQSFSIIDFPEVSVVAPVDKSIIQQDQILTVLFDRPLRVLTGDLRVPEMLRMNPAVKGEYDWLGTSGFEFVPENGWPASTNFTITIPAGTKMADGGSTVQDKTWGFSTPALTVALSGSYEHHKPKQPVKLAFNYVVDPAALAKSLVIQVDEKNRLSNADFEITTDKDDPKVLSILRKQDFELGDAYTFKLPKGETLGLGPLGLEQDWQGTAFMDEKEFKLLSSYPNEASNKYVDEAVSLCFNNPVDTETAKASVEITPPLENLEMSPYAYLPNGCANPDATMMINGRFKPSTAYTITLKTSLADIYGQKLPADRVIHFTTNPYRSTFSLSTYSIYGVLASHLPRIYQLRTMNWEKPVDVTVSNSTFEGYVAGGTAGAEKGKKTFDTQAPLNTPKILDVDLDQVAGQKLANGYYVLAVNPHAIDKIQPQSRALVITDTALTVKRDRAGKILVWANDLKTGAVVPDLVVRVWSFPSSNYDRTNLRKLAEGKTNAQGIAALSTDATTNLQDIIVEGSGGGRLGYVETDWNEGISVWNYGLDRNYDQGTKYHIGYLYTERRIYRPDQKVFFKGVMRLDEDARLSLPTVRQVQVTIEDGQGNQVFSDKLPLNAYGTFNGSLQLDPSMKLGSYRLSAIASDTDEAKNFETYFDVREYRRPDFKVDATAPQETVFAGQEIRIPVQGAYYYGTPLKGAKVSYSITRSKLFFQPMQGNWWNDWYSFAPDEESNCYWYCPSAGGFESVQNGDGVLDEKGNLVITLPANLSDYKTSATYAVDVTVTDVNQRTVSSRLEFPVYKGQYYVGIRADYASGWNAPNADFELVSVNVDGSARANVNTTIKFYKRVWNNNGKVGLDGNTTYDWQKNDTLLETKTVTTDGQGKARVSFGTQQDGEYVAIAESRDSRGQQITSSVSRYVYRGSGESIRTSDDHQMKIVQTKASYEVGDTAILAVQTPYENTKALVTIERNTIREYRVIDLGSKQRTVEIKITDADTPNIYVSVLVVKGGGENGIPEFRLGYANLQVNTTKKILNLTVTPDREAHRPGESVTLFVESKNSAGAPVSAEVSLAVVDERVIALLGNIDKDILGKFWFPRLLGVDTGQSLTMLVKKVFFSPTEGGGGGKGDGGSGPAVRGNFQDTAYWNATVVTGADGKAQATFKLPDNLTAWNVLAIGETKNTEVGHAQTKLITRRELMAEPLLPRILRKQDTVTVGATVVNATEKELDAQAVLKADGVAIKDNGTRTVHLKPQERAVVRWTISVPTSGTQAKFTVTVNGGGYQDGFEMKVPILDFSVPEVVSASGILEKNVTEQLQIPDGILPDRGQVDISVQPNIGNSLQAGLEYLVHYPYGCSEQKTSGLLANLMYVELGTLGVSKPSEDVLRAAGQNVRDAIKILLATQHGNGGWGFWPEYDYDYPWLTGYVMWGLTQAQQAGFEVDATALDRADQFLREALRNNGAVRTLSDAERAQILLMLSERNTKDLSGYASALYERRSTLPEFAKLFLAMAYTNLDGRTTTSVHATELINNVKNKVIYLNPSTAYVKEQVGYEDLLSSDLRTTSLYLQALLRIDPKNVEVERLLRYLVQNRKDGYWYTTNDTALTLLSLVQYARANPVDQSTAMVSLYLDNQLKDTLKFAQGDVSAAQTKVLPLSELSKTGADHQIGLEKDSDKRYFYDINMKVYREIQDIEPFDNGMTVVADVYALTDAKNQQPLTEVKQGENVLVRMKVLVPKRRRYVALEYHLPAGLEGIDFSLKTSPQMIAGKEQQCYPDWQGKQRCLGDSDTSWWWENIWRHIEYRDDRVFLFADTLEPGVYEYSFIAQATTPGEYRVPPTRVYEFYNPTSNAHNEGKVLKVIEK